MTTFAWVTPAGVTVPLDGSAGVTLVMPVEGLDVPPVTWGLEDRVAGDGAIAYSLRAEERPISLRLIIDTDDVSMREVARMFAPVLSTQGIDTAGGTLIATTDSQERTLENVIYEGGLEREYSANGGGGALTWRDVTVRLLALDPLWYGPVESDTLNVGTVTTFDSASVTFDDPDTPFDGGDSTEIPVAGDMISFPVRDRRPVHHVGLERAGHRRNHRTRRSVGGRDQIIVNANPVSRGPTLTVATITWSLITPSPGCSCWGCLGDCVGVGYRHRPATRR